MSKFGFDLLEEQICELVIAEVQASRADALGDSEIEKLLFQSIRFAVSSAQISEIARLYIARSEEHERSLLEECAKHDGVYCPGAEALVLRSQSQIGAYRVDFLLHAVDHNAWVFDEKIVWRKLVVECDGHDFHERNKEQAARDRSRDRALTLSKHDVMRFTGSEIWRDPLGCAEQVLQWAVKDWGGRR